MPLNYLQYPLLSGTLTFDDFHPKTFLIFRVEDSMRCIVGLLTGNDCELQQEAAWCLTNISAGTHDHALLVAKAAAPYLVTFLSGSNQLLQV